MYWYVRVYTSNYRNNSKTGFRGTHRDATMLPGPSERVEPEVESALDEDRDPNPCEEDEEYVQARPNAKKRKMQVCTGMYQCILVNTNMNHYAPVCTSAYH